MRRVSCRGRRGTRAAELSRATKTVARFFALVGIATFVLSPLLGAFALTQTTIAIDGDVSDWAGVLADDDNSLTDTIIPNDPDPVGQADRDIDIVAATFDDDYLYMFARRTASGTRQVTVFAYIDNDGDGLMQSDERCAIYSFNNTGYLTNENSSNVVYYSAVDPDGDEMLGDGYTMPGSVDPKLNRVPGADYTAAMDATGLRFEMRVSWETLGAEPGSPVTIHFSLGNGVKGPLQIEDNVGDPEPLSLRYSAISLVQNETSGGVAGSTVEYTHTLTNTGNDTATFDVGAASEHGWTTSFTIDGDSISSVTLDPDESATVAVSVTIPLGTANGTRDVTTVTATSQSDSSATASVYDTTVVGSIIITPDHTISAAQDTTVTVEHTVTNISGSGLTLDLTALSSLGWDVTITDSDGDPLSSVTLADGDSTTVQVHIKVPTDATLGDQDTTTLKAAVQGSPATYATARTATTVREALTITPDRESAGGPGTSVSHLHTITNSTAEEMTVDLDYTSSEGWTVRFFASDGVTEITQVTVGPYGESQDLYARVYIPADATLTTTDETIVTAESGSYSDSVTDLTTVETLLTYDGAGYQTVDDTFVLGDTVYARGMGLSAYRDVYFRWIDPNSNIVYTSEDVAVDDLDQAINNYAIDADDASLVGTWTIVLYDARNDTEIARHDFTVSFDAQITALSATDAPSVGDDVAVISSVRNDSGVAIDDSDMNYVIWWDSDADGVFGAGDLYIQTDGSYASYDGTSTVSTHVTNDIDVASGGTWSEPSAWTISNAGFPNAGTYRVTATWTDANGGLIDEATTEFYSIPTLGWPLFALGLLGAAYALWRRGMRRTGHGRGGVAA